MLKVEEIPVSSVSHPKPPNACLPQHEFSIAIIAPKGSGKTTLIINILRFYAKYFNQIIIFSPSIRNDEKWAYVKKLVLLKENRELKKIIQKIRDKKTEEEVVVKKLPSFLTDSVIEGPPEKFDGKIPEENFLTEYSPQDLNNILDQQQEMIDFLEQEGYTRHKADRILLIFDDLVGSSLYSNAKSDPFKMLNANHRHYSTSMIMISQAYKEIPKTVRTNFSCLILFRIDNEQEKKVIFDEYPMGLTRPQWDTVYRLCTKEKYGFLFFNTQQCDEALRIMKCFKHVIGDKFF
jgi:hypothetical protein